jgi:acetate kinase
VPDSWYHDYAVRRYGFHGTSHHYVAKQAAEFLGKPLDSLNLITLHLGNGASVTAIQNGQSVDTSMGLTPLEGLIMGTRSGDIDPAIPFYLGRVANLNPEQLDAALNKQSGCKGLCGENDMRVIHALADAGNEQAQLTLNMVSYRLKKYLGSYFAVLGRVDAIVFTGGIGENDALLRAQCCAGLQGLGIAIAPEKNQTHVSGSRCISPDDQPVAVLVIPTNEELEIASQALTCIAA